MSTVEVTRPGPGPTIQLPPPRPGPPAAHLWATTEWSPPTPTATLPRPPARPPVATGVTSDARLAVRRFVSVCVEVLNGYRPATHLRRLAQPREAPTVVSQGLAAAQRVAEARRTRTGGRAPRPRRPAPAAVVRVQLCQPRDGAVEAALVIVIGDRTWAMALRLELHDEAWLATTLRLI